MAITKLQPNAIPSGTDFTIQLTDGSVVASDLHTDMDLSGKTVTLPTLDSLDVAGQFLVSNVRAQHQTRITAPLITGLASDGYISIFGDADATNGLYVKDDGNVGIGTTSPAVGLHYYNTTQARFAMENASRRIDLMADGDGFTIRDQSAAVNRLRIDTSGNVGIGTSSPTENLTIFAESGNADVLIESNLAGDDARLFFKRATNASRAYTSYTNVGTGQTIYTGLLRNNNNTYSISNVDDYGKGVIVRYEDLSLGILEYGSGNSDNTDTNTHRKLEIWANGPAENTYKRDCFVQNAPGFNTYSWYKIVLGSNVYGRGGSIKYTISWSTAHAAGSGICDGSFTWRGRHNDARVDVTGHKKYNVSYINGTYYGWSSTPNMTLYESSNTESNACLYMRVQGHIDANSSTYDGGVVQAVYVEIFGSQQNISNQGIYFVGHSTPGDAGGAIGDTTLS